MRFHTKHTVNQSPLSVLQNCTSFLLLYRIAFCHQRGCGNLPVITSLLSSLKRVIWIFRLSNSCYSLPAWWKLWTLDCSSHLLSVTFFPSFTVFFVKDCGCSTFISFSTAFRDTNLNNRCAGRCVLGDCLPVEGSVKLWSVVINICHIHHHRHLTAQRPLPKIIGLGYMVMWYY